MSIVVEEEASDEEYMLFLKRLSEFVGATTCQQDVQKNRNISADILAPYVKKMRRSITKSNAEKLATELRDVASIDMGISSEEAKALWLAFMPRWTHYIESHPFIKSHRTFHFLISLPINQGRA